MGALLERRRVRANERIGELRTLLDRAESLCADKACVYATGSFSRGEASQYSDLDLFIVGTGTREKPTLSRLDSILIKADLIDAVNALKMPKFSGDGEYLSVYTVDELVRTLGKPEDDVENTFTARLLLLLESRPLLGERTYHKIISDVVSAYWRDYPDHKGDFVPAFLGNDILRMWRTFYEAQTRSAPPLQKAKRKLKNFKLKHRRLLTCYSALLYLLAVHQQNGTVSPTDAVVMIGLTPTQRLEWLASRPGLASTQPLISSLLARYETFLSDTDFPEDHLIQLFHEKKLTATSDFGELVFRVLDSIGQKGTFYRLLIV